MNELFPDLHWTNLLIIPGALIGFTIHELAHALAAYFLGDNSQVERGKFTLNPMRHISWFGAFAFILFGIGWPNPMEADPRNLRQRRLALSLIALAGPVASFTFSLMALLLTLTIAATLVYSSGATTDQIFQLIFPTPSNLPETLDLQAMLMAFTSQLSIASFWLAITSLLPLPGLDGFIFIANLVAYVREGKTEQSPAPQARPAAQPHPHSQPINQYRRRNNVSDIHFKLGAEYHQTQQYEDAIVRYRQAIQNDKNFGPAYVNMGLAYLGKGKRREAIHAFRGAIQFADDQKSQQEAWYQLHQLSEVSPIEAEAEESLAQMGLAPWTDTKPRPNWLRLGVGSGLLLLAGVAMYGYLLTNLIEMLQA